MNYIQITMPVSDPVSREILIATLSGRGYEGFEEEEDSLHAFYTRNTIQRGRVAGAARRVRGTRASRRAARLSPPLEYTRTLILPKNWNEQWEKDFQPVVVGGFCAVRAFFHEPIAGVKHDLLITPKMSFGTGHHATTYMMMEAMQYLDFSGAAVLDFQDRHRRIGHPRRKIGGPAGPGHR